MKGFRKVRPDAVLKNLPEERQAEIAAFLEKHSYPATLMWLAEDGVQISRGPLQQWYRWYRLRERMAESRTNIEDLKALAKSQDPTLDQAKLDAAGQALFQGDALRDGDAAAFIQFMKIRARMAYDAARLKLEERKVRVREASLRLKQQQAGKPNSDQPSTIEDTDQKVRQFFGMG